MFEIYEQAMRWTPPVPVQHGGCYRLWESKNEQKEAKVAEGNVYLGTTVQQQLSILQK